MLKFAIFGNMFYVCLDVVSKYFLDIKGIPIFQYFALQSFLAIIMIVSFLKHKKKLHVLNTTKKTYHILRGFATVVADGLIIYSLKFVPLADIYPMIFTSPFFMIIFARLFLKEIASTAIIFAVVIGFIGVIIALDPSGEFNSALLMPLLAAIILAINYIVLKIYGEGEDSLTYSFYIQAIMFIVTIVPAVLYFVELTYFDMLIAVLGAIFYILAVTFMVNSYLLGKANVVSAFVYSQLLWAILLGFLIFSEVPTVSVLIGASFIVVSGLFVVFNKDKA